MTQSYELNAPTVSGEVIDGEAIIMHLRLGHYFSTEGSGALIWSGIEQAAPLDAIARALAVRYGIDAARADAAVATFVAELARHDLIRPGGGGGTVPEPGSLGIGGAFTEPRLEVYTDMQDLLLLDPIHDVDEAGWPIAPPGVHA